MTDYRCDECNMPYGVHKLDCGQREHIRVLKCSDSMMWYNGHVGEKFILLVECLPGQEWVVRASDGYNNIIKFEDGEVCY